MGEHYFADAASVEAIDKQYGLVAEVVRETQEGTANALTERYNIREDDIAMYWRDVLGAALLEQDRLDAVDEQPGGRYGWALDRSKASGSRLAFTGAVTAVDGAATVQFVPAFTDGVLTVQDAAGGAVAAATLLAGGATAWMLHDLHERVGDIDAYVEQFNGVATHAEERVEEQYVKDISGAMEDERYQALSEVSGAEY